MRDSAEGSAGNPHSLLAQNSLYRLLNVALLFGTNIIFSRMAGVAGYGALSLLLANASLFNLVSAFGSDAGVSYHAASGRLPNHKLLAFVLLITGVQVLAAIGFNWFFYAQYGHFWFLNASGIKYGWWGVLYLTAIAVTEKYAALLNGNHWFSRYSKTMFLTNLFFVIGLGTLYFTQTAVPFDTVLLFYIGLYVLQASGLVIAWHTTPGHRLQVSRLTAEDSRVFFSYTLTAFIINCIQFLAYRVDYWLLDYYRDQLELGWYSMAVRLSQFFWIMPLILAGMIGPIVAAAKERKADTAVLLRWMNGLNIVAGLLLYFIAGWLIPFLSGKNYGRSVELFRILLPGVILFCNATIIAAVFAGKNKLRLNFLGSFLCLAFILVLDLYLIPSMGMKGAAIASSIGYGLSGLYFLVMYVVIEKQDWRSLLIPRKGDLPFISSLLKGKNKEL